ncbi:MAG: IS21 family transposase [Propionibacteriaceae bacterium]|nr:IS21 family transposase [Propionibacteriaceae bacterium]
MDIIAAFALAGSYRGAAEICDTTHKTVKRVVTEELARMNGQPLPARRARVSNTEVVRDLVGRKVTVSKGKISAKRLLPVARAAGYGGSDRNFRRLVADAKRDFRRAQARASGRRPAVWSPGEHLVIDWGVEFGLHVFCAVAPWSRFRFVRFAADETAATTLRMLAECFEQLGGVPKVVLADRMACLKGGVVANRVIPTPDYVRFATHYRFRPDFCEAADPESKGIVEALVNYAKADLMVPLATLGEGPLTLEAANVAALAWCAEVNAAVHSETMAVPADRLETERAVLTGLPSLGLRIGPAPVLRKVDRLSCIRFGSARYSVPVAFIGARVEVDCVDARIRVIDTTSGEIVADHQAIPPGEASVLDEHYPKARPTTPRRAIRPRTAAEVAFCALGPAAQAFIAGAAAAGSTRLAGDLPILNDLTAAHGLEAMTTALERAVEFRRWRADDVRSILHAGVGLPAITATGADLDTGLPQARQHDLAAYAIDTLATRAPAIGALP